MSTNSIIFSFKSYCYKNKSIHDKNFIFSEESRLELAVGIEPTTY
jgi:hypothetical protein